MNTDTDVPIASDDHEELADWIERQAIVSDTRLCSRASLVRSLRRTGTMEAMVEDEEDPRLLSDSGSVVSQQIADDAFDEIEDRGRVCGSAYPFEISEGSVRLRGDPSDSDYVFFLMLTKYGPTPGHAGTAALFEHLCTHAAHNYFGGAINTAKVLRFGAPRPRPLASIKDAIDDMCSKLREGGGCKAAEHHGRNTGDGQLDIVAWRAFPNDDRVGKLIAFGQCAAGRSGWEDKLNELDSLKFAKKYLREPLVVDPVRLFFVPWRISPRDWAAVSTDAGIVFDRTRIVACLGELDPDLARLRKAAAKQLIARARGVPRRRGLKAAKQRGTSVQRSGSRRLRSPAASKGPKSRR